MKKRFDLIILSVLSFFIITGCIFDIYRVYEYHHKYEYISQKIINIEKQMKRLHPNEIQLLE